jgi:hypothetical protein
MFASLFSRRISPSWCDRSFEGRSIQNKKRALRVKHIKVVDRAPARSKAETFRPNWIWRRVVFV